MGHAIHRLTGWTRRVRQEGLQHGLRVRHLRQRAEQGKEPGERGVPPDEEPGLVGQEADVQAVLVPRCTFGGPLLGLELGQLAAFGGEFLFQPLFT
jgi:hypothetical protein